MFEQAESIAEKAGDSYVTAERLLLALARSRAVRPRHALLGEAGLTPQTLNEAINDLRKGRTADRSGARSRATTPSRSTPAT